MSGPTLMTAGVNQFANGINRSILVGLFGKKQSIAKDKGHYPTYDLKQFSLKDEKQYPTADLSRYNY